MLSCTAVRVSTRFGSELSIRAVGQYRFAIRACRTTANRCCRITFQPTTTHFSFRKRGIHSIASPLANRMSAKKIAETGRRQDTLDACSFSYPAYAPDGLSPPFPSSPGAITSTHASCRLSVHCSGLAQSASSIRPSKQFRRKQALTPLLRGSQIFY